MLNLDLPFEHVVIGYIGTYTGIWVAICRKDRVSPFVTYSVNHDGSCHHGGYHDSRYAAFDDLMKRYKQRCRGPLT